MTFLSYLYTVALWQPLYNGLIFFYNAIPGHDLGLAIIALTIVIRLLLSPFLYKAQRSQRELAVLQPEIKKIQERFKKDKEAQGKAMMELYATHKVNPFSGCLILLLQLPILIALFQVFRTGLDAGSLSYLYSFVANPGALGTTSFGILDLTKGSIYLGVVAAVTQYAQTKLATPPPSPDGAQGGDFAKALQWQTTYFFPLIILFWSYSLPSALTLYWTAMNIFGILEQLILHRQLHRQLWKQKAS
ncbi:MAG: hypothetical protein A3J58_00810 [Candidatus Sungbacteria bacterium RIFCSPHIGHO2_02_FULL_52_23]|uniref:Membrane insertase YidC/Oxa/ALB C-terminal domain-containing protein n=1 Tax=Candidatus Sungbacteria bacterium RIFCSPHIGHO2_02_FULL_52_23 TaxID=1802274 RepID=A0A1G2KXW1_9BACT|nr:MAG: hypothetical protein A3J58_00810 [Candidatus Sungbacteria bacterium RIFCSPHIGHO2_02_FULL_52_23]